jgi:cephalosporin hydroxylase
MKITIDTQAAQLEIIYDGSSRILPLYSDEAFNLISKEWLRVGWNQKYVYTFSWMGRPVIQLPEDMIRVQEAIYNIQPDVILETGVAHGGSLIFYASLCKVLGKGRVVGIDIEIRAHNRKAIEAHELFPYITLIEGSSTSPEIVEQAQGMIKPGDKVLVLLDSNHSYEHVTDELKAYHSFVTPGSFIVSTDGIMRDVADVPRAGANWATNNPSNAAIDFAAEHPEFELVNPSYVFNESTLTDQLTHWPAAWLRRRD